MGLEVGYWWCARMAMPWRMLVWLFSQVWMVWRRVVVDVLEGFGVGMGYDGPTKVVVWIGGLGGDVAGGRPRLVTTALPI